MYIYIVVTIILPIIAFLLCNFHNKKIWKLIHKNEIFFIKKSPQNYKFITGDKEKIKNIYPFFNSSTWSGFEQNVLATGNSETFLNEYDKVHYSVTLNKIRYGEDLALSVKILPYTEQFFTKEFKHLSDNIPSYFFIVDDKYNIIFKNKKFKQEINVDNLFECCANKHLLEYITKNCLPSTQMLKLFIQNKEYYIDAAMYPKRISASGKMYWLIFGYDVTPYLLLKRSFIANDRVLDISIRSMHDLLNSKSIDKTLQNILYLFGSNLDCQRASIYRKYKDNYILEHDWKSVDINAENILYDKLPCSTINRFLKNRIEPTIVNESQLKNNRKNKWASHNIKSKVCTPLFNRNKEIVGFISFDCYQDHRWTEDQLKVITLLGISLNTVLVIEEDEKQITALHERINSILKVLCTKMDAEVTNAQTINNMLIEQSACENFY